MVTCGCLEEHRCQRCGTQVPVDRLWSKRYTPAPGERELAWCPYCSGDCKVLVRCSGCVEAGNDFLQPGVEL
jgi:hypothetical protein